MIVEQIWTGNSYRNFNYLIACPETGDALAIDPLDFRKCLAVAADPLSCTRDAEGRCTSIDPCFNRPDDDDCLSVTEERAWSSPIFVDQPRS